MNVLESTSSNMVITNRNSEKEKSINLSEYRSYLFSWHLVYWDH